MLLFEVWSCAHGAVFVYLVALVDEAAAQVRAKETRAARHENALEILRGLDRGGGGHCK